MGLACGELKGVHVWLHAIGIASTGSECILVTTFGESDEILKQVSGSAAVPDVDAWTAEPGLDLHEGDGDILGVVAVKAPKLSTWGWLWNAMSVVVKTDCLVFRLLTKG